MEISHHKASIARGCWKKYYWRYVKNLDPITKSIPLTLGTIIHDAFEKFYKGESDTDVLKFIKDEFDKQIAEVSLPDQEDLIIHKYMAMGMWEFNPLKKEKFEFIEPEEEFLVKLGDAILKGRIDGRVKKNNTWWVREVKTTAMNQRQFEGRMRTSSQASGYVYALRRQGYPVEGVMVDYLKRSLLKKRAEETAFEFAQRVYHDYHDKPKYYFGRIWTYRSPVDFKHYEEDMSELVDDIQERMESGKWYRNYDQCWNFNAECPYKKICYQEEPDKLTLELYFKKGRR